jgi:hypothetical protein
MPGTGQITVPGAGDVVYDSGRATVSLPSRMRHNFLVNPEYGDPEIS